MLVVFVILVWNSRRWFLARKDHDTTHGIIAIIRPWLAYNNLYCMYGMCYFEKLTELRAYGYVFMALGTFDCKIKGPT